MLALFSPRMGRDTGRLSTGRPVVKTAHHALVRGHSSRKWLKPSRNPLCRLYCPHGLSPGQELILAVFSGSAPSQKILIWRRGGRLGPQYAQGKQATPLNEMLPWYVAEGFFICEGQKPNSNYKRKKEMQNLA